MHLFYSNYTETTALSLGVLAKYEDTLARANLIRELGGKCVGQFWNAGYGIVPLWEFPRTLSKDEKEMLCLEETPLLCETISFNGEEITNPV